MIINDKEKDYFDEAFDRSHCKFLNTEKRPIIFNNNNVTIKSDFRMIRKRKN